MTKPDQSPHEATAPPSPCTKVCQLSTETGLCIGCRRTPNEIQAWPSLSDERKRALLADLKQR